MCVSRGLHSFRGRQLQLHSNLLADSRANNKSAIGPPSQYKRANPKSISDGRTNRSSVSDTNTPRRRAVASTVGSAL